MIEQVKTILADLGFSCQEKDLSLSEVKPLPKELYVREKIDPQWVENLKEYILEGALQPFIVCARVEGLQGLYLVDTHHTYHALKAAGKPSAKALVVQEEIPAEKIIIVQLRLNRSEQKPLTLRERKQAVLKHYLNIKNKLGKDFYKNRGQIIQEIMQETGLSRTYIYKILEDTLQKEKEELKQLVKELYSQGKSQYEIEEMLGVPQQTVSYWLNENNLQIITNPSTAVDDFSLKRVWTEEGTLDREFLELLSGKLEEGIRVQEFLEEYGKAFKAEDVKRFGEWIRMVVEEAMLESHGKKDFFVYLMREKLPVSERALKNLYEHAKSLVVVIEKARQEFRSLVEELCLHDEAVSEEAIYRLIKERLHEKRTKGKFGEGNEYAIVSNFILRHFNRLAALEEEKIKECVQSMPVLNADDVELDESLLELSREEFEKEIRARHPHHRVPQAVLQKLWERLRQEKEKREREREMAILEELLQRAKDPYVQSVDSLPKNPEETKVLKKYYHEVLQAFNSVKTAKLEDLKDFQGETLEELKSWLVANGFRVHNAEKLLAQLKEKRRAMELLEEFREFPYASIEEFREKLSDQDRLVFAKYSTLFFEEFAKWPKAGDEEHIELARRMLDEGLSEEEIRLEYWQKTGKIISPATLYRCVQKLQAERTAKKQEEMLWQAIESMEEEETEKKKHGIKLRGVLSAVRKLREKVQQTQSYLRDGNTQAAEKLLEKIAKDLQELEEKVQYSLERDGGLKFPNRKLAVILIRLNDFSMRQFDVPFIFEPEEMGKFMKLLDDALGRYLKVSGFDPDRDFQQILRAFLETYAYAYLRYKPTNEMFLRKFLFYRDDIRSELDSFRTTKGKTVSIREIKNWVENYLKEVSHAGDSN
jgi:transcriptional regulator with XRE-family HTH domain/arginine repressor